LELVGRIHDKSPQNRKSDGIPHRAQVSQEPQGRKEPRVNEATENFVAVTGSLRKYNGKGNVGENITSNALRTVLLS